MKDKPIKYLPNNTTAARQDQIAPKKRNGRNLSYKAGNIGAKNSDSLSRLNVTIKSLNHKVIKAENRVYRRHGIMNVTRVLKPVLIPSTRHSGAKLYNLKREEVSKTRGNTSLYKNKRIDKKSRTSARGKKSGEFNKPPPANTENMLMDKLINAVEDVIEKMKETLQTLLINT